MSAERARSNHSKVRPEAERTGRRAAPVEPSGPWSAPPTETGLLQLQRSHGNRAVHQLLRSSVVQRTPVLQRSALSDDLTKASTGKSPAEIFALVGQKRFRDGALDPAELTALTKVLQTALPDRNDCWVALRILGGRLGMSQGVTKKEAPALKKDIPPLPIEVSFVQGLSSERALVVAGVHGSERQGIDVARTLIDDVLTKRQPHYSVILVPSLFPQHAHAGWGVEGRRQGGTQTNRNFPSLEAEVASYKGGQALDPSGKPVEAAKDDTGTARPILPENVMLMELIDRFHPSRVISIHGTQFPGSAGIFADPHFLSPAKEKAIDALAALFGFVASMFGLSGPDRQTLVDAFTKADETRTKNDVDLALATAYAIADKTKGAATLKARFTDAKRQSSPSVAGNRLYKGTGKEESTWREDIDTATGAPKPWRDRVDKKGTSLGLYAPAKGISVFTVEPPVNRARDFYDDKNTEPDGGPKVSKADRDLEIKAYAEAVATILLGPDSGGDALRTQRPATP